MLGTHINSTTRPSLGPWSDFMYCSLPGCNIPHCKRLSQDVNTFSYGVLITNPFHIMLCVTNRAGILIAVKADPCRLVGRYGGAAGTLLVRRANTNDHDSPPTHVVLHQRTSGDWAFPGGVIDKGETPREAAFRESFEEASLPQDCREGDDPLVIVTDEVVTYDHRVWKYTVVVCNVTREWTPQKKRGDYETLAVEWVPVDQVAGYNLHSDFKTHGLH